MAPMDIVVPEQIMAVAVDLLPEQLQTVKLQQTRMGQLLRQEVEMAVMEDIQVAEMVQLDRFLVVVVVVL
jgi:hypothetical protein